MGVSFAHLAYGYIGYIEVGRNFRIEWLHKSKFLLFCLLFHPGSFNPFSDDPLPAYPKKQLILKIISGQQLPKPPDSMLGDRGEVQKQQKRHNSFFPSLSLLPLFFLPFYLPLSLTHTLIHKHTVLDSQYSACCQPKCIQHHKTK